MNKEIEIKRYAFRQIENLNELWIQAYNFIRAWSVRTGHIEIVRNTYYVLRVYLKGDGNLGEYWEGSYFHDELNRLGWKIIGLRIFYGDIEVTLKLGDVFDKSHILESEV